MQNTDNNIDKLFNFSSTETNNKIYINNEISKYLSKLFFKILDKYEIEYALLEQSIIRILKCEHNIIFNIKYKLAILKKDWLILNLIIPIIKKNSFRCLASNENKYVISKQMDNMVQIKILILKYERINLNMVVPFTNVQKKNELYNKDIINNDKLILNSIKNKVIENNYNLFENSFNNDLDISQFITNYNIKKLNIFDISVLQYCPILKYYFPNLEIVLFLFDKNDYIHYLFKYIDLIKVSNKDIINF